jgi:alpha-amylase
MTEKPLRYPTVLFDWGDTVMRDDPEITIGMVKWQTIEVIEGIADDPGLIYVLNNLGDNWNGSLVTTNWPNASFQPVAWCSKTDLARPINQFTDRDGRAQFYSPPRGYAVYAVK